MGAENVLGHAQQLLLGAIRVHHDPALEVRGGARDAGDPVSDEPARARFGNRHHQPPLSQQAADDAFERVVATAEAVVAQALGNLRLDPGEHLGGSALGDAARAKPHPDLAGGGKRGDLDIAGGGPSPQPLGQPPLDLSDVRAGGLERLHGQDRLAGAS